MNNPRIKLVIQNGEPVSALADGDVEVFIADHDDTKTAQHTIIPQVITRAEMSAALGGAAVVPGAPILTEREHCAFPHGRFAIRDSVTQK